MSSAAFGLLAALLSSAASMNDQSFPGTILDERVRACGVLIGGEGMALIRPFIETAPELSGSFRIEVVKSSPSGTSTVSQSNRLSGGGLGNVQLAVDRPSRVAIRFSAADGAGAALCRLDLDLDLSEVTRRI